jgi:DNA-binding transcriptional regulator YdaS (Cro superfamily)
MLEETPLQKAIRIAGGQSALARKATEHSKSGRRLTQKVIWKWLNQAKGPVPSPMWVLPIESAVEGKVSRHELRRDLYPVEQAVATLAA